MSKVRSGEAFKPSAATWNRLVDLTNQGDKFLAGANAGPRAWVWIRNSMDVDVSQYGVMAVADVIYTPTDNAEAFDANQWIIDAALPVVATHTGRFAIAIEPIADTAIGRAMVSGVTVAKIEIDETWHEYADVKATADELISKPGGGAQILWKESGTGTGKRAIVRLGPQPLVIAGFNVDSDFTTSDGTETADIDWCNVPGYINQNITIENHDASSAHIFSGSAADRGTAYYDATNDKWRLIQMEC